MPYLQSNDDVRNSELYNKAIGAAALIVGAAALGQSAGKGLKGLFKNWGVPKNGKDVVNKMYGKQAAKELTPDMASQITHRASDPDGPQFDIVKSMRGHNKVKRTDGSFIERFRTNRSDDVKAFNRQLKDLHQNGTGNIKDRPVFGESKLSIYEDVMRGSSAFGVNIDSKQGKNLADNIYSSEANFKARKKNNISNQADDWEFTKSIWGDMYDDVNVAPKPMEFQKALPGSTPQTPRTGIASPSAFDENGSMRTTPPREPARISQYSQMPYDENGAMRTQPPAQRMGLPAPSEERSDVVNSEEILDFFRR